MEDIVEYTLLIGVIAFLAIMAGVGYKKGFVKIVLSLVATIVTIILATILTFPVSAILKSATPLYDNIYESVESVVKENEVVDVESINNLDLPKSILNPIVENVGEATSTVQEYVAESISDTILNAIVFLALIIIVGILVRILISVLDIFSKLPIINGINKSIGAIIGLIYGLVIIWIACLVLAACSDKSWAQSLFAQINDNSLLSLIYNNNMVIWIVAKVLV